MELNITNALRICAFTLPLLALPAMAKTVTFNGPQDGNGFTCNPAVDNHCIIGDPLQFQMFSAALTSPAGPGDKWRLNLQTNYPKPLPGGDTEVIPEAPFGVTNALFAMCDFMIEWNNQYFGIVLRGRDNDGDNVNDYIAGHLYKVDGFTTSGAVLGTKGEFSPRPSLPAHINSGGMEIGTGTISASKNVGANGITAALYTVLVDFEAPTGFLATGNFTIYACSFVCDNGRIVGQGTFEMPPPPPPPEIPEPSTYALLGTGLCAVYFARRKR